VALAYFFARGCILALPGAGRWCFRILARCGSGFRDLIALGSAASVYYRRRGGSFTRSRPIRWFDRQHLEFGVPAFGTLVRPSSSAGLITAFWWGSPFELTSNCEVLALFADRLLERSLSCIAGT